MSMKRHLLVAVTVLAVPATAAAQLPRLLEEGWGPRVRATPFVGFSPGFESTGFMEVATRSEITSQPYSFSYAPGPVSGLNVDVRVYNRFSVIASGMWTSRGRTRGSFIDLSGDQYEDSGSDFLTAKLGGSMRFREGDPELQLRRLSATVFAAGAFIREVPEVGILSPSEFTKARNHWGVNFGADGELPLQNRNLAFLFGFEDFVFFWDEFAIRQRLQGRVRESYGREAVAEVDANHSHMFVLRFGLTFRADPF